MARAVLIYFETSTQAGNLRILNLALWMVRGGVSHSQQGYWGADR